MRRTLIVLAATLLLGVGSPPVGAQELVVGYNVIAATVAQLWVTHGAGVFQRHGLKVNLVFVQGGTRTTQALLAGDLAVAHVASPSVITSVAQGAQVVFITGMYRTLPYVIYGAAGVAGPAQLRGKQVGITSFGDLSEFGMRYGLRVLGLDPDKDVTIVQVGGVPLRLAALQTGRIGAAVLIPPFTLMARKLGLPLLVDLIGKVEFAGSAHAVRRADLARRRDTFQRFVDAVIEGNRYFKARKQESVQIMARYLRGADSESLEESYEAYAKRIMADPPLPSPTAFQNAIDYVARDFPQAARLRPADLFDSSLVEAALTRLQPMR
ncbi:MAG: ABC transporter substrate-binding protein [Deltaproteobacteria bacterium]|nr:ABC transporter substrate-binding protein [Deltaproteobacteria bacterium]